MQHSDTDLHYLTIGLNFAITTCWLVYAKWYEWNVLIDNSRQVKYKCDEGELFRW